MNTETIPNRQQNSLFLDVLVMHAMRPDSLLAPLVDIYGTARFGAPFSNTNIITSLSLEKTNLFLMINLIKLWD